MRCGGTLTTRSPAANSACSRRRETSRQSSIAHTRSSSRPRAYRTAARCPGSSALISRLARARPVPASTAARACVALCVSAPITIMSTVPSLGWIYEADLRWTAVTRGDCHAPIRSHRRSSGGDGRHKQDRSNRSRLTRDTGVSPSPAREPIAAAGRHRPDGITMTVTGYWAGDVGEGHDPRPS